MDGSFLGDFGMLGVLVAATANRASLLGRIRIFAELGGLRNPEKLTDEKGKALILGTIEPGVYEAEVRTVLYQGTDGIIIPVEMIVVFDPLRRMWVGKSIRQWNEESVRWRWEEDHGRIPEGTKKP